jgi:hypothetical protein
MTKYLVLKDLEKRLVTLKCATEGAGGIMHDSEATWIHKIADAQNINLSCTRSKSTSLLAFQPNFLMKG